MHVIRDVSITDEIVHIPFHIQNRTVAITALAFCPKNAIMASGCASGHVDIYDANCPRGEFRRLKVLDGEFLPVLSIDFTTDGTMMQASDNGSLRTWSIDRWADVYKLHTLVAEARDADWATWTSILGWPVQGCRDKGGIALLAADRSPFGHVIVTGNECGVVKLQRYPAASTSSLGKRYALATDLDASRPATDSASKWRAGMVAIVLQ